MIHRIRTQMNRKGDGFELEIGSGIHAPEPVGPRTKWSILAPSRTERSTDQAVRGSLVRSTKMWRTILWIKCLYVGYEIENNCVPRQGCKMDCGKLRIFGLRLRKDCDFPTKTIHFSEHRSQSQHNVIWFSRRSQLRNCEKLRNRWTKLFSFNCIIIIKYIHCKIQVFSDFQVQNVITIFCNFSQFRFRNRNWFWKLDRNFATNTIWFSAHFTTLFQGPLTVQNVFFLEMRWVAINTI